MALRGTQNCPIEIEDGETTSQARPKKRKVEEITIKEDDVVLIENTSATHKESKTKIRKELKRKKSSKGSPCATRKSVEALVEKFTILENRLETLEKCLARVSQVFLTAQVDSESCKDEEENSPVFKVQDVENISENVLENVNASNGPKSPSDISNIYDGLDGKKIDNHESSAIVENIQHNNCQDDTQSSTIDEASHLNQFENLDASSTIENILHNRYQNNTEALVINEESHFNKFANQDTPASIENVHHISNQNDVDASIINQTSYFETSTSVSLQETRENVNCSNGDRESSVEDEQIDSKWNLLNVVIKREVDLYRDDQGRILMFLSCAFKKLSKPVPGIAATSGVFIGDEFRNEYNFVSHRKITDVRIEAEIRATLFGIELVKGLYREASDSVCLMVISSFQPLVKLMKEQSFSLVYPNFYSCSCKNVDCNHSITRWSSTHSQFGNQGDLLPQLIMTVKGMKVHWCSVDNISDEEKKILNKYSLVVQESLNKHFAQIKNRLFH